MNSHYHIATANAAQMRGSYDDPVMAGFVAYLEPLNALADRSPGFVWRLQDENGDATSIRLFDDPLVLFNMSVWESIDSLQDYVYKSNHVKAVQQRGDWFKPPSRPPFVVWWIPAGHIPEPEEGRQRLQQLWDNGPTAQAFTFRHRFDPPDRSSS